MKYYTFEELKQMAFSEGITGNKVTIGIWAKMKGFLKKKKQRRQRALAFCCPFVPIYYLRLFQAVLWQY